MEIEGLPTRIREEPTGRALLRAESKFLLADVVSESKCLSLSFVLDQAVPARSLDLPLRVGVIADRVIME